MSAKHIEHSVRHPSDKVPPGRTDWARLRAMSEEEVLANAEGDQDNPPMTLEELAQGTVTTPAERRKVPIYIRLDADIVEHYKRGGPGYQTRINAALRRDLETENRRRVRYSTRSPVVNRSATAGKLGWRDAPARARETPDAA